jgi:membrane associated rhomboid family serine protease
MGVHNRDYMRGDSDISRLGSWRDWPVHGWIILTCIAVFAFQFFLGMNRGGLEAPIPLDGAVTFAALKKAEFWRLVTYQFLHGGVLHLLFNIFMLWSMSRELEPMIGRVHFLAIYLLGGVVGALAQLLVFPHATLVGASAGVLAITVSMATKEPHLPVGLPFLPGITLKLKNLVIAFIVFDMVSAFAQIVSRNEQGARILTESQVASMAHLGGALLGFVYTKFILTRYEDLIRQSERNKSNWRPYLSRERTRQYATVPPQPLDEKPEPVSERPENFMENVINPILEKMAEHGKSSLSEEENRLLKLASDKLRHRDKSR